MQQNGTITMDTINARRYPLLNRPRPPADQLTYCQVVLPIIFQDEDPTFFLTASGMGEAGPSTLSIDGATQATLSSDQVSFFKICRKLLYVIDNMFVLPYSPCHVCVAKILAIKDIFRCKK